jgi:HMP-PP phosphatase
MLAPNPKLFAFDIDGTLLESGHEIALPLQTTLQALERLGHHIVLITGRTRVPVWLLQQTRAVAHSVCNGARVFVGENLLVQHPHDPEFLERLLEMLPPDAEVTLSGDGILLAQFNAQDVVLEAWHSAGRLFPLEQYHNHPIFNVQIKHPSCPDLRKTMQAEHPQVQVFGGQEPYLEYLSFVPVQADKGTALEGIAQHLGVALQNCLAFGDADNDLPMLERAGVAVQLGDHPVLKNVAHWQLPCDGVALAQWLEGWITSNLTHPDLARGSKRER